MVCAGLKYILQVAASSMHYWTWFIQGSLEIRFTITLIYIIYINIKIKDVKCGALMLNVERLKLTIRMQREKHTEKF